MPLRTPEFYTQLGVALLQPQQWQMYYEPDPFAFIVQNLVAAMMLRKGMRQQSLRDMMEWMTQVGATRAMQWLKFQPFRDLFKKQTGLKEKDLQRMEAQLEELLEMEQRIQPPPSPPVVLPPPSSSPVAVPLPAPLPPATPQPTPAVVAIPQTVSGFVPHSNIDMFSFPGFPFSLIHFPWVLY
jgi:hypothetical protein